MPTLSVFWRWASVSARRGGAAGPRRVATRLRLVRAGIYRRLAGGSGAVSAAGRRAAKLLSRQHRGPAGAQAKRFAGGMIASLSIPWGFARATTTSAATTWSGRATWWRRAGGCSRPGRCDGRARVLDYLHDHAGGGRPLAAEHVAGRAARTGTASRWTRRRCRSCWSTCAAPRAARSDGDLAALWPMVRTRRRLSRAQRPGDAAGPLGGGRRLFAVHARGGDRRAAGRGRPRRRRTARRTSRAYLRETADAWNATIERWTYVDRHRTLAQRVGVDGYYVRIAPPDVGRRRVACSGVRADQEPSAGRHGPPGRPTIVSPDALALVRFGLRAADDPRIVDTVKVIDALLEVETADRPDVASLQRRRLRRARGRRRRSTAPASAAAGRC